MSMASYRYEVRGSNGTTRRVKDVNAGAVLAQELFHAGHGEHWVIQIRETNMWDSRKAYTKEWREKQRQVE
jgi:hypothetical protein